MSSIWVCCLDVWRSHSPHPVWEPQCDLTCAAAQTAWPDPAHSPDTDQPAACWQPNNDWTPNTLGQSCSQQPKPAGPGGHSNYPVGFRKPWLCLNLYEIVPMHERQTELDYAGVRLSSHTTGWSPGAHQPSVLVSAYPLSPDYHFNKWIQNNLFLFNLNLTRNGVGQLLICFGRLSLYSSESLRMDMTGHWEQQCLPV